MILTNTHPHQRSPISRLSLSHMFSRRTDWKLTPNRFTQAQHELHAAGREVLDLSISNPTRAGFDYDRQAILRAFNNPAALDYDPQPKGLLGARQAVAEYYRHRGKVNAESLVLTTSTSEGYSFVFRLMCNPEDEVLVPKPSYPLFEFLADLQDVKLIPYPLLYDHGWQIDFPSLDRALTPRTRAVVLVHPNNPTGHFTKLTEARELAAICREHELALIVDEVFLDYGLGDGVEPGGDRSSFAARELDIPVFIVSGISKICALPQMKAAWLVAVGPGSEEALTRLEVVADTYLSMNAPVQEALPVWLEGRAGVQTQIRDRTRSNLTELDRVLATQSDEHGGSPLVNRLRVEGGWYAVLRVPAIQPDEITSLELLKLGVLVHPGYFFGMAESGWLVVSLLAQTREFSLGVSELLGYFRRYQGSYL